jgi:hypothetical protein
LEEGGGGAGLAKNLGPIQPMNVPEDGVKHRNKESVMNQNHRCTLWKVQIYVRKPQPSSPAIKEENVWEVLHIFNPFDLLLSPLMSHLEQVGSYFKKKKTFYYDILITQEGIHNDNSN